MKETRVVIRVSLEEKRTMDALADYKGLTLSSLIRHLVATEAKKIPDLVTEDESDQINISDIALDIF